MCSASCYAVLVQVSWTLVVLVPTGITIFGVVNLLRVLYLYVLLLSARKSSRGVWRVVAPSSKALCTMTMTL